MRSSISCHRRKKDDLCSILRVAMAKIKFTENALKRIKECKAYMIKKGDMSLNRCIYRLSQWSPENSTITIMNDRDEMSFFFRQTYADGRDGLCGGVLYHGERDGFGSGSGPVFAVTLEKTEGYSIHT